MGVVYEAQDPKLHRNVAIKTILTNRLDSETAVQYSHRFMREAQAVARLNHPGIVQIHDFGEEGDIAYIVMEYVRGRELNSYFNSNERFEFREAARIMTELLDALEFAHQAGIVHRDVKPANVMIDAQRRAKLTDFGVARVVESEHTMAQRAGVERTQAGAVIGTPAYMSPEQITGETVDHRTDIFSAGIIFYQLLTGEKPFGGTGGWTVAKKIVQDDPPMPSTINVSVPALFDHVVRKALAKQASERFQSAREFATALNLAVEGKGEGVSADATVLAPEGLAAKIQPHAPATSPKTQPFVPPTQPQAKPAQARAPTSPGTQEVELEFWRAIKDGNDPEDFELYVQQFPSGVYANLARRKIAKLRGLESSDTNHQRHGQTDSGLDADELARRAAEDRRRKEVDDRLAEKARQEAEAKRKLAEDKARLESELAKREEDFRRREAEAEAKRALELKARASAEEKARLDAIERAKKEAAAEMAKREADYQRREAELMARSTAEEKVRLVAIEKARLEAIEKAKQEAAAELAKREAEYKKREAELLARSTAEEKVRLIAIEKARLEAIEKAKLEAAVELAKRDAEYKKREAEAAAKAEAAARARREADEQAKREAELRARQDADLKAKREAEYQKREAELKKREADEKTRREAAERARKEAEERVQRVQRAMDLPPGSPAAGQGAPVRSKKPLIAVAAVVVLAVAAAAVYRARTPAVPPGDQAASQAPAQGAVPAEVKPAEPATPPASVPSSAAVDAARQEPVVEDKAREQADAAAKREAEEKAKRAAAVLKSRKEADAVQNAALEKQNAAQEKAKRDAADAMAAELAVWNKTKASNNPADYDAYLQQYPNGHFVALARSSKESLVRHQQEAKELQAQRARLEDEKRKALEQEARRQAETRELEQKQKAESKDTPRKPAVFVAPTF